MVNGSKWCTRYPWGENRFEKSITYLSMDEQEIIKWLSVDSQEYKNLLNKAEYLEVDKSYWRPFVSSLSKEDQDTFFENLYKIRANTEKHGSDNSHVKKELKENEKLIDKWRDSHNETLNYIEWIRARQERTISSEND